MDCGETDRERQRWKDANGWDRMDGVDGIRSSLRAAAVIPDINSGAAKWLDAGQWFWITEDDVASTYCLLARCVCLDQFPLCCDGEGRDWSVWKAFSFPTRNVGKSRDWIEILITFTVILGGSASCREVFVWTVVGLVDHVTRMTPAEQPHHVPCDEIRCCFPGQEWNSNSVIIWKWVFLIWLFNSSRSALLDCLFISTAGCSSSIDIVSHSSTRPPFVWLTQYLQGSSFTPWLSGSLVFIIVVAFQRKHLFSFQIITQWA